MLAPILAPGYPMDRARREEGRSSCGRDPGRRQRWACALVATTSLSPRLDAAALAAARNWHYIPATRGGVPVTSGANVLVDFRLSN
ncbi:MAG: energy transducer TonB [Alphaproteobacteria bacterium]